MPSNGAHLKKTINKGGTPPPDVSGLKFVTATFRLVNDFQNIQPRVCGWAPNGLSFGIFCTEQQLAQRFKPGGYFRHSNYRSFVRQLNHYGFRKLRDDELASGALKGAYYQHDNFLRGRPDLLRFICAKVNKGENEERSQLRQRIVKLELVVNALQQVLTPQQRQLFQQSMQEPSVVVEADEINGDSDAEVDIDPKGVNGAVTFSSSTTPSSSSSSSSYSSAPFTCHSRPRRGTANYKSGTMQDQGDFDLSEDDFEGVSSPRTCTLNCTSNDDEEDDEDEDEDDDEDFADAKKFAGKITANVEEQIEERSFSETFERSFSLESVDFSTGLYKGYSSGSSPPSASGAPEPLTYAPSSPMLAPGTRIGREPSWGPDLQPRGAPPLLGDGVGAGGVHTFAAPANWGS